MKSIERDIHTWKTNLSEIHKKRFPTCWHNANGIITGLELALRRIKEPSNKVVEDGQAIECRCPKNNTNYGESHCDWACDKLTPAT